MRGLHRNIYLYLSIYYLSIYYLSQLSLLQSPYCSVTHLRLFFLIKCNRTYISSFGSQKIWFDQQCRTRVDTPSQSLCVKSKRPGDAEPCCRCDGSEREEARRGTIGTERGKISTFDRYVVLKEYYNSAFLQSNGNIMYCFLFCFFFRRESD